MNARDFIDSVADSAVQAHESQDEIWPGSLRHLGAVLAFQGLADNGGLVGGAIENQVLSERAEDIQAASAGFRWLGMTAAAALVDRAEREYLRMRPSEDAELSSNDEALWEELDDEFFQLVDDDAIASAAFARRPDIAPEQML